MTTSVPVVPLKRPAAPSVRPGVRAGYMRDGASPFFSGWHPALRDSRDEVRRAWTIAAARTIDHLQNSGWLAGGIEQAVTNILGSGLKLKAMPDAELLGWNSSQRKEWTRLVEGRFHAFANNPSEVDAEGRSTLHALAEAALTQWFGTGEIVALLPYIRRPGSASGTKIRLWPSHRLAQTTEPMRHLFQGVVLDGSGRPSAYRLLAQTVLNDEEEREVRARDATGRPVVLHLFLGGAGQVRGITPLVPVLKVLRQFDQLADATLTAALIQTIFAATIESDAPSEQLLAALLDDVEQAAGKTSLGPPGKTASVLDLIEARAGYYESTKIDYGRSGKIASLFPGEKLKFNKPENPTDTYKPFAGLLLRECARCIGITYEEFTGDYSESNFSSGRLATGNTWKITVKRRERLAAPFYQAGYEAWLEEEVEAGRVPFAGGIEAFHANRAAACGSDWHGPPPPQADDLKTAKSHETYRNMGIMADAHIAAALGYDIDDVYEQRAAEKKRREELGIEDDAGDDDGIANALVTAKDA